MCVLYNSFVLSQNKWVFGEECSHKIASKTQQNACICMFDTYTNSYMSPLS